MSLRVGINPNSKASWQNSTPTGPEHVSRDNLIILIQLSAVCLDLQKLNLE